MNRLAVFLLCAAAQISSAENPAAKAALDWRVAPESAILAEFTDLLAIPNIASDEPNIRRNAAAITKLMEKHGVSTRLLETPGAPPVVYGEISVPSAARTVVFYAHYDGQPLDPKEWATDPWKPVIKDGHTYAPSTPAHNAPPLPLTTPPTPP